MKIYVVKYALTEGIEEREFLKIEGTDRKAFSRCFFTNGYGNLLIRNTDFALTMDEARAKAYAMRDKKIASLKKNIAKLEKMEF